jgi:hypothetical protein
LLFIELKCFISDQAYSTVGDESDDDNSGKYEDPAALKKKASRLGQALSVLAVKPSTFHTLNTSGKLDGVSKSIIQRLVGAKVGVLRDSHYLFSREHEVLAGL